MIKSMTFLWIILAVAASGALFRVSYRVQHLQKHLTLVDRQIGQEQERVRVLQAEWNHLNDPARLEALARKHLGMAPALPSQIVAMDMIPAKQVVPELSSAKQSKPASAPGTKPILASLKPRATDD